MSRIYNRFYWPPVDQTAVTQIQNVQANVPFILNGSLYDPLNPDRISFIDNGYTRTVGIVDNGVGIDGAIFTVTGFQNGVPVTDTIHATSAEISYGNVAFDYVTSITSDTSFNGISVSTGDEGYLPLIKVNTSTALSAVSYGINLINPTNNVDVALLTTYEEIYHNGRTIHDMQNNGEFFILSADSNQTEIFTNADTTSTSEVDASHPNVTDTTTSCISLTNYLIIAITDMANEEAYLRAVYMSL